MHQDGVTRVLRYLKSTVNLGHIMVTGSSDQFTVHVHSNWAGEPGSERKSRTGIVIMYGNSVVLFSSALQKCIFLSSSEEEYAMLRYHYVRDQVLIKLVMSRKFLQLKCLPTF